MDPATKTIAMASILQMDVALGFALEENIKDVPVRAFAVPIMGLAIRMGVQVWWQLERHWGLVLGRTRAAFAHHSFHRIFCIVAAFLLGANKAESRESLAVIQHVCRNLLPLHSLFTVIQKTFQASLSTL